MVKKLNIYFIHSKGLKERQSVIDNFTSLIKKYRFRNIEVASIETITGYDPEDIDVNTIRQFVDYAKISESHVEFYNQLLRNLHINQLSNTLKHFKALELIAKKSNDKELNLVLEDDVLYEEKVCMSFERMVQAMPEKFDMIMLGMPTTTDVVDKSKFTFQDTHKIFKILPVCDSYLVSHSTAKALVMNYVPIKFNNATQLSYVSDKLGIETIQSIPNVFIDGSKYGLFLSKLSSNNPLIFNNDFVTIRALASKEILTKEDIEIFNKLINKSAIKDNPDFVHMECLYYIKQKKYKKALDRFTDAYNTYMNNGCILSNDSVFLRDFIRTHKYIQTDL
jgi:GR25 family glycosyltransferase involved in LPS biosynthesis